MEAQRPAALRFVATSLVAVAPVFGLWLIGEPSWPDGESPVRRPFLDPGWGLLASALILALVMLALNDLHQRSRAAALWRAREGRYRHLFDANPEPMWVYDAESLGFLAVNDAAERAYGYSRAEFLRMTVRDIRPFEDVSLFDHVYASLDPHEAYLGHWRHRKKSSEVIDVEIVSRSLEWAGRPARLLLARDVTERMRVERALRRHDEENARLLRSARAGRRRLRRLSRKLVRVQEVERRRIACELHDEIGQGLTGLKLSLELAERRSASARDDVLVEALYQVETLIGQVRRLSLDLRPAVLDDLGLLPALLDLFSRYTASTGVGVRFEHAGIEGHLAPEIETAAYRIIQEALTNCARHARVGEVWVRVGAGPNRLALQVHDRGAGFDLVAEDALGRSSGLSGMRERARLLGGHLTVESSAGTGTRLTADLPLGRRRSGPDPRQS